MSDVFVSYKAEDRARVRPLVAALEADGLTVWWDAQIQGGAAWRQSIQHELERAGCILVVWSKRSVGPEGEFVHDEASMARKRGVYLPVRIDAVEPPLGFGQTQALALTGWKGERSDPRYQALLGAARGMIGGEAWAGSPPAPERKRIDRRLLLAGGGVLAAGRSGAGWAEAPMKRALPCCRSQTSPATRPRPISPTASPRSCAAHSHASASSR
jgi:serine/threonine-protein kinase